MQFRSELDSLSPYKPPRMTEEAVAERGSDPGGPPPGGGADSGYVKLTSNELSFGPLPEAEAALSQVLPRANRYPDRNVGDLRAEISAANPGIEPDNVLVGNGSSEVLLNLLQLAERPGNVVFPWPSFGLYRAICTILGLETRPVSLTEDYAVDPDALAAATDNDTRAVILCNPNNPTGTYLTLDEVRSLADSLPAETMLILDEAYFEFVEDPAYRGAEDLTQQREDVVTVRTFAKAHGLAGLRVGYGLAPARVADYVERVRFPFSVNAAAQAAAAASMREREQIRGRAEFIIRERGRVQQAFAGAGLPYIPSQGNYVMVGTGPQTFERNGVLVREGEALGFPAGWSRVTIGDSSENDRVIEALESIEAAG
ncbi:pyridoxal phosphate-dependent aminotransferase [Rubrobacter aplysinae]|uniref:pyridoxal phosphate-dependent aminotransferase n=1 Tax=Rubrobacter aplysinae TaxID=909625 RepID=UPI00069EFE3A|nr:aminotransferase class I/II-fold pyridoxal phosphate-dependent enzyme [Rubrobacter aplysinae]